MGEDDSPAVPASPRPRSRSGEADADSLGELERDMALAKIGFARRAGKGGSIGRHQGGELRLRLRLRFGRVGALGRGRKRAYAKHDAISSPASPGHKAIDAG